MRDPATASDPSASDIRVGLIGYGHAGAIFHAPLITTTPGLRIACVVTGNPERQAQARRDLPGADILESPKDLWDRSGSLDLVVIAAPNRFHVSLALAALAARLPVVVDKPLAPTAAEARSLVDRFAKERVLLTVFQNRRWDGDFLTVQRLVQEGRLGSVHRFESRFERWRPELRGAWRESGDPADGGGLLLDLGSHLIDQALLLFGPVTGVYAEIDSRRSAHRADDDTFVAMTHASGVRSHLWMSALAGDPGPRFRVLGSRGAFVKRGMDVQEEALYAGARPGDPGWGEDARDRWGAITAGATIPVEVVPTLRGSYETFYRQLVHTVLQGEAPPVEPVSAVVPLDLIDAARLAAGGSGVV